MAATSSPAAPSATTLPETIPPDTIVRRLFLQAANRPDTPAYYVREPGAQGVWRATTWADYAAIVRRAACALIHLGVEAGDTTCILGFNSAPWVIFDLATMAVGGAPAGIYTTSSGTEVRYIVGHANAKVILVENLHQLAKVKQEWSELPSLTHVVLMTDAHASEVAAAKDPRILQWSEFLALGDKVPAAEVDCRVAALEPSGLATLIYTSGTTGPPKGVMLSHRNLTWTASAARGVVDLSPRDCVLSYLPLSHIAEQMFSIHGPISAGLAVYFAESLERVPENLKEVQPTVFFGVPRIWEKFYAGVQAKLKDLKGAKRQLFRWASQVAGEVYAHKNRGEAVPPVVELQFRLADRLMFQKIKTALGMGRARICVSGAAPVAKEILEFFQSINLPIYEVYGQSEGAGPTSFCLPNRNKPGTVGPAIPGVEVRIADDEEILVRGPNVFMGYFRDGEATQSALVNGWLHSGDLGRFDGDGFLCITGRKKDILITAGGKNIAPKNIESSLKNHAMIAEVQVIGDRRKYLTALVWLDEEAAGRFAKERGLDAATPLGQHPAVIEAVQAAFDAVNAELAQVEKIKKFTILPGAPTIEGGELTPSLKLKRNVVTKLHEAAIEAMYS
jgi:long-chain acyl-CoA synthetase